MLPNLLLLHGALGSAAQFDHIVPYLEPHFRTFCIPFSGHGGIPASGAYAMSTFAEEVIRFMDEQNIPKAHCFGYSMGGYVGLQLARTHPARLDKIITLGTKFSWTPESAAREAAMLHPDKVEAKVPAFARMLEQRHAPLDWKDVMRQTATMLIGLGNGEDRLEPVHFSSIRHIVQFCRGSEDHMVSQEETEQTCNLLPNGRLEILEGFPHPLEQTDPVRLSACIIRFLSVQGG